MTRYLYLARHGDADAFGQLTDIGRSQAALLGRRLAHLPIDVVWHSPLPRAVDCARVLAQELPVSVLVDEAEELIDHVPYVPPAGELPAAWAPFFDGYDDAEAAVDHDLARRLSERFGARSLARREAEAGDRDTHEVLITHAFQIAWLICDALEAPPARWLGLNCANAALTLIEHREGRAPTIVLVNDMSHLPRELQWTGFPGVERP
ncbi:histidine phosphatase family protein [Brachybacterium sp. P6-10-X1]|uniref:histidine phosphatase family protein n=1 Tax=Brachybacterium sp. P6-10-X1 TaxID=1903186 RepID=UPI0009718551|nr:histidine phosphatase family protein [Brachybacterium sp. P6-10-X1]APX33139.1 histidine phosphatase family protein [Brachybacterium sp. P6-10-X1]